MTLWPIWINRPLVLVADPGVGWLLTSGDARRVAGVSVTNLASLVPTDHHQRSSSLEYWLLSPNSISHHPVPGLWLLFTWCSSMGLLKPHSHTHSSRSLVLPRLTFLSVLIFLCLIIVFWLLTVSLVLDWYLPGFWPFYLPWYSALVSPLISLLPLPTTACTTVLTHIKAANGSPLCWLIITVWQMDRFY